MPGRTCQLPVTGVHRKLKTKMDEKATALRKGAARSVLGRQHRPGEALAPGLFAQGARLRCRHRVRPGSLPNSAKGSKAQESSVHFLEWEQEFPGGWPEG